MSLINFKLKNPDEITPFGTEPDTVMHWFGLTDSDLWLSLGNKTLYEYTDAILQHLGNKETRYNNYYLSRFIEDLTDLIPKIAEPIPGKLYDIAKTHSSLYNFCEKAKDWLFQLSDTESADLETYYDKYKPLTEWIYSRTLESSHLKGGPHISFFRHGNKISLVWKSDYVNENRLPFWTAGNGELEMEYGAFVYEIEDFGRRFFDTMENHVALAVGSDWGHTVLDKSRLMEEQIERKSDFWTQFSLLKESPVQKTEWGRIENLMILFDLREG